MLLRGQSFGLLDLLAQAGGELFFAPQVADGDAVLVQRRRLTADDFFQNVHQAAHLVDRAAPVLGREGVEGQDLDADIEAGAHRAPHVLGTGAVPGQARQTALRAPSGRCRP